MVSIIQLLMVWDEEKEVMPIHRTYAYMAVKTLFSNGEISREAMQDIIKLLYPNRV